MTSGEHGRSPGRPKRARAPMPPGREARPQRSPRRDVALPPPDTGRGVVTASVAGTGVLVASAVPAAIAPHPLAVPALVVAVVLFAGGLVAFVWAYAVAVARSRTEEVSLVGVFGLSESAPGSVKARLFGSLGVEIAVGIATAGAHPYSSAAFGVLAVMWGLGLTGLWGARYGAFPPRRPQPSRRRRAA